MNLQQDELLLKIFVEQKQTDAIEKLLQATIRNKLLCSSSSSIQFGIKF
jgi:hypothetical protein